MNYPGSIDSTGMKCEILISQGANIQFVSTSFDWKHENRDGVTLPVSRWQIVSHFVKHCFQERYLDRITSIEPGEFEWKSVRLQISRFKVRIPVQARIFILKSEITILQGPNHKFVFTYQSVWLQLRLFEYEIHLPLVERHSFELARSKNI